MKVITMPVGELAANCYIVYCKNTMRAVVIDPGAEGQSILNRIQHEGVKVEYILLTHGHFDHIGAVKFLKEHLESCVAIHAGDAPALTDASLNLSTFMGGYSVQTPADVLLKEGDVLDVGGINIKVLHTPGHSEGSACFVVERPIKAVFTGDTLFQGAIGRSDFPGGSYDQLISSIRDKLLVLDDDYTVYPGHGLRSTIGTERIANPFIK
ncbi:glyoxylase-like metal-dependent hydrolase (beta-lactamase superfamily II) [Caldicoprobacter guelmensis]|uniref:MBL fold metallo-hydrolase n=1 Tax=Caldicoprobacter guelmensis TaxID=1170224 RepID=UPI00195DEC6B|nr:MBL fold metallo-hydrolase [Caldicoprobacter guelmensis]MBM7582296.1 glyoxylase-like metal-dependent hydrolase (beta-lactamase superfamily II) [Caldicoprobacter guelmensis]